MCGYAIKVIEKGNLISSGNIMGIRRLKRQEQFKRGQSLKGKLLTVLAGGSIFHREFTWYYKKEHLKNWTVNLIFALQILHIFSLFKYLWASSPRRDLLWSAWKMSLKIGNFHPSFFPGNYFIFNWFVLHICQQKKFELIAFLTNLWYSSMVLYEGDMTAVNYKQKKACWKFVC